MAFVRRPEANEQATMIFIHPRSFANRLSEVLHFTGLATGAGPPAYGVLRPPKHHGKREREAGSGGSASPLLSGRSFEILRWPKRSARSTPHAQPRGIRCSARLSRASRMHGGRAGARRRHRRRTRCRGRRTSSKCVRHTGHASSATRGSCGATLFALPAPLHSPARVAFGVGERMRSARSLLEGQRQAPRCPTEGPS